MNRKKFALIGVLALVVIGCVLAAGCTGQVNTDADQVNPASGALYTVETPEVNLTPEDITSLVTTIIADETHTVKVV